MTRSELTRSQTGNAATPIIALVALFGLTLVVFYFQYTPPSEPGATMPPATPGATTGGTAQPQAGALNPAFMQRLEALQAAVRDNPSDTAALSELSGIWLTAHQPERGLALSLQWTEVAPTSVSAWLQLVTSYGVLERWDEAFEASVRLLELDPGNRVAMVNMGSIQANRQRLDEARSWWTRVVEEAPGTSEAEAAARSLQELGGGGSP